MSFLADTAGSEIAAKIPIPHNAVSSRFADFWLLGGASIVLWAVMAIAQPFRGQSDAIESHFMQVGAVFSMMSIFCNHPHFIISYRFGYGRGTKFIFRHWFSLLLVPLAMIAFYALAYLKFDSQISELPWVLSANRIFGELGLAFRLGTLANLGTEILSLSILLMYVTVGWHYAKQVFGCVMVYAHYDKYPITSFQRAWVKGSLFSVAFFNFFFLSIYAPEYNSNSLSRSYFFNIPLIPIGLPRILIPLSAAAVAIFGAGVLYHVFYANFRKSGRRPSWNLVIPWIAFHVWWIPFFRQTEYYFAAIPFFHSLQYLPFAYRLESSKIKQGKWLGLNRSLRLALLLFVGFCAFELVPGILDRSFDTMWYLRTWFFMIAFAVFINVHHFFIDSVVWRFNQAEVRDHLL